MAQFWPQRGRQTACGTVTVTSGSFPVSFPLPFAAPPVVVASVVGSVQAATPFSVTTTGFLLGTATTPVSVNWVAMQP